MSAPENSQVSTVDRVDPAELKISVYRKFDDVETIWLELEESGESLAFQHFWWLKSWHEITAKSDPVEAYIVVVEDQLGEPLMLLPLGIQRRGFATCLVWLGGVLSDYHGPVLHRQFSTLVDESVFTAIWRDVKASLPRFDVVVFEKQPDFIGAQKNPFLALSSQAHPSDAHYTELSGSLETFISSKRSKKSTNTEKRKERRLAEHGQIQFVTAGNDAEVNALLPVLMDQKSIGYRKLGVSDLFEDPDTRKFIEYLSANHNKSLVLLCGLKVGERMAATFWGLVYKHRLYYLLPAYEHDDLTRFSPGNILLRHIFDWSFSNGVRIFDFTVGDEPYKKFWCDHLTKLYDHFEAASVKGYCYVLMLRTQRKVKRRIKRSRWLSNTYLTVRKQKKRWSPRR